MKKKGLTILIISLLLIGLATYESIAVNNLIVRIDTDVKKIYPKFYENESDITILYDELNEIDEYWTESESIMCLMFNHKDLGCITDSINKLKAYTRNNDYDNAIAEIELLKGYTEKNTHILGFNIHNIL